MSYKTRFQPQEHLGPNGWVRGPEYREPGQSADAGGSGG